MKTMFTNLKVAWLSAVLLTAFSTKAWADTEPNNTLAQANPLSLSTSANGELGVLIGDNSDIYQVPLTGNGEVTVNANFGTGLSGRIFVYRPSGAQVGFSAIGTGLQSVTIPCEGSGFVYVQLSLSSGSGAYTVQTNLATPSLANDTEPNNTIPSVIDTYNEGESFTGQIGYSNNGSIDGNDYFTYNNSRNGSVTFSVNASEDLDYRIYLYRPNGTQLGITGVISGGEGSLTVDCLEEGTYVGLVNRSAGCGSYSAEFNTSTLPNANDAEPNNTVSTAVLSLQENETFTGQLGHRDNVTGALDASDYFIYEHPRNGSVTLTVNATPELAYRLYLYRVNGAQLGISSGNLTGENSLTVDCLEEGTYVGLVFQNGGCGSYSAQFSSSTLANAPDMEPNNTVVTAIETYQEGETFTGQLGHRDDVTAALDASDYFFYEHPRNGAVTFSANLDPELSGRLFFYRPNGAQLGFSATFTGNGNITIDCLAAGTYVGLVNHSGGCGSYTASFSSNTLTFNNDTEPNNTLAEAPFTWITKFNQGQLGHANNVSGAIDANDYYAIKITEAPQTVTIPFEFKGSLEGRVFFYNQFGSQLALSPIIPPDTLASLTITVNSPGIHYVLINRWSGCGSYRFGAPCTSGGDLDRDNICDVSDTCLTNAGIISVASGNITNCLGENTSKVITLSKVGDFGPGRFALITFPEQDVVASNATGIFDMAFYPADNYRLVYASVPNIQQLSGITNGTQLSGCYDISNLITVNTIELVPGTIAANGSTNVCIGEGFDGTLGFTSTGASGGSIRWAVLDQTASTVLLSNSSGSFDFSTLGAGTYRVVQAIYFGVNPSTIDPQALPSCVVRSNLVAVNVSECPGVVLLQSQPNPTLGISTVSFTLPENDRATLEVFDMSGRLVQTLFNQDVQAAQEYRLEFNGGHLPNGVYLYRLTSANAVTIDKFMIAR